MLLCVYVIQVYLKPTKLILRSEQSYIPVGFLLIFIAEREARQQISLHGEKSELAYIYLSVTLQECN